MNFFYFHCNFQPHVINLAQNGQIIYENQAHNVNLPKMENTLQQLLGNQIDHGTAIDFHVSHTASPVVTGGIWWAKPPKFKYENYKWVEFCQCLQCQGINGKQKLTLGDFQPTSH